MDAFVRFFDDHLEQLEETYSWPVSLKAQQGLTDFAWHPTSGSMNECIAMKHHLTDKWATANDTERAELARWIVSDWGGVRTNDPATLASYVRAFAYDDFSTPLKGIASYSKILSMIDCRQYAIYDARVAACLNAVQLLMKSESPLFFNYIPGRNKAIQGNKKTLGFVEVFTKNLLVRKQGWKEVRKDESYKTYLNLLHTLKGTYPDYEIYHFEMTLFSKAPELCIQAMYRDGELTARYEAGFHE